MADHLGQFGAAAGRHVHIENDQVGLEIGQRGHRLQRLGQGVGEYSGAVEYPFGVGRLGPRVVDDQHLVGVVLADVGQGLDPLQQAGSIQHAGKELAATGAHGGQAGWRIGFFLAEEQQWQFLLQAVLHVFGQTQATALAGKVDVHEDGRRVAFGHRRAKAVGGVQGLRLQAERLQLLAQALALHDILQGQVHRLTQGRQWRLFELVAVPQAGA